MKPDPQNKSLGLFPELRQCLDHGGAAGGRADPPGCPGVSLLHQKKYSVPEASRLVGVSETELRVIIQRGELPVIRILKTKVLILESELEAFLQSRHGTVRKEKVKPSRMPSLPEFVAKSKYLHRKAS